MELEFCNGLYFLKNDIYIANVLRSGGKWESWLPPIAKQLYKPGTDILDCGAHIGCHSVEFAKFGPVHAFEPIFHEVTQMNAKDLPITVHPYGLSDENKSAAFYIQKVENGTAVNYGGTSMEFKSDTHTIGNLKVLDELYTGTPSVVKIDVEGHELQALRGMKKTLSKHKPALIIEILASQKNDVDAFLKSLGYTMMQALPEHNFLYLANLSFS